MPRPTNKVELQQAARENYDKLQKLIESFTPEEQVATFPFEDRDRNLRDVLIHLHEWHNMTQNWYTVGMSGKIPAVPKEGYTFKDTPALNQEIWENYQQMSLPEAKKSLQQTHEAMLALIDKHTDEELFTKKYYPWTRSTSLGSYLISATSSHYDWALKKLKKYQKTLPKKM